jgi:hypothetical protein
MDSLLLTNMQQCQVEPASLRISRSTAPDVAVDGNGHESGRDADDGAGFGTYELIFAETEGCDILPITICGNQELS